MGTSRSAGVALTLLLVVGAACSTDGGSTEELCAALAKGQYTAVFSGFDPADPTKALDQLRTARVDLGELKDRAPKAQRADLQIEIDYVQALVDAVDPLGTDADVTTVAATMRQVTDDHPEVAQASARLAAFQRKSC